MNGVRRFCLLPLCLTLAHTAMAGEEVSLTLSNQEWPPYMGEALPQGGVLSDVVALAFSRIGVKVRYVFLPTPRALASAASGRVDGSIGWTPTAERRQNLMFSGPVMTARMVFFQRSGETFEWRILADLAPYRIGVTVGNTYSAAFSHLQYSGALQVDPSADDLSNLRKLAAGRVDLFPIEATVGRYLVMRHFPVSEQTHLQAQSRSFWSAPLCVAIRSNYPGGRRLLQRFDKEIAGMKASGELNRLLGAWQVSQRVSKP